MSLKSGIRGIVRRAVGTSAILERMKIHEEALLKLYEATDTPLPDNKSRWRNAVSNDPGLTGGQLVDGGSFITNLASINSAGRDARLLEIGPGNGRLLNTLLERNVPFASYTGIDLSRSNIAFLQNTFPDPRLTFLEIDVEEVELAPQSFDLAFSSLTFKHLFPSFERAAHGIVKGLTTGGRLVFDLPYPPARRLFAGHGVTYFRAYDVDEITLILHTVGLQMEACDTVDHGRGLGGLFVVGKKD